MYTGILGTAVFFVGLDCENLENILEMNWKKFSYFADRVREI